MEKEISRRQKRYKKQKRNNKKYQTNLMRHHAQPQGSRSLFGKSNRPQTTSSDIQCLVPTHDIIMENSSEYSQYYKNRIISVKRHYTFDKKIILPTSSNCGKKYNAIMIKADLDLEMIILEVIKNVYMNFQNLLLQVKLDIKQTYRPPTNIQFAKYLLNVDLLFMRLGIQNIKKFRSLKYRQEIKEKNSLQIIECQENQSLEYGQEINECISQQKIKGQPKERLEYGIEIIGLQIIDCRKQIILFKDNRQENGSLQKIKCQPYLSLQYEVENSSQQIIDCQQQHRHKQIILFKENKQEIKERRSQQKIECPQKLKILFKENRQFKISVEQRCIRILIFLNEFHTFLVNLIQTIANISKFWNEHSTETKSVPSISVKGWHIRNMTQEYLLTFLLRNCNVASLNTMRNLYFVIITNNIPNLTIEFNFKLLNRLIMENPFEIVTETTFETIYFNEAHKYVLDNSTQYINATVLNFGNNTTEPEDEDNSSETCTIRPSRASVYTDSFVSSSSELGTEYFDSRIDSKTTIKDSLNTLTYSIDERLSYYKEYSKGDFIDLNFGKFLLDNIKSFHNYLEHGTSWITNILRRSNTPTNSTNDYVNNFCVLNEGLFDLLSFNDVENIFGNLTTLVLNPDFCKLFAKDLGKCTIHTLFNYYPVPVNL